MTLDDAIRRERHAMRQSFGERSAEHRQLAEWLKELKQWKELVDGIDLRPASLMVPFQPNVNDLERENEKLRELVRDMWRFTGEACKKYPRLFDPAAQGGQMAKLNMIDAFEQRMRELGIEVDNG